MADPFIERLRRALAPEFEVERVLGAGGMGIVVLAREVSLDRRVAIKTIRPEHATAVAVERFLREAQTLASLAHPNIVPIHRHEVRDGLPCIVMALLEGQSLKERLDRGPLPPGEVVRLGRDVLAALEAAHARGIVHRDVKPANIFLQPDRAVLADFGIAKATVSRADALTETGEAPGTLAYMSPEQLVGLATPASDVYALGLVLYEAATGRPWPLVDDPAAADWRGVPRPLASALRRALAPVATERWRDAASFRSALRPRRRHWLPWAVAASAVVVASAVRFLAPPPPASVPHVAIVPFDDASGGRPGVGADLAVVVREVLRPLGNRLTVVDARRRPGEGASLPPARYLVDGEVAGAGEAPVLHLRVRDQRGAVIAQRRISGDTGSLWQWKLGERVALAIVDVALPGTIPEVGCRPAGVDALEAWLAGEEAFRRDDWRAAEAQFLRAVERDRGFCTAQYRLWLVQRWRRKATTVDLRSLLDLHRDRLPPVDRALLEAELQPTREARRAHFEVALAQDPFGASAPLQYGAELMHRGPLDGIPLDSAVALLREAIRRDSSLAPAHDQLVWALIRLGRREDARAALNQLERHAVAAREIDPAAFEVAFAARFATEARDSILGSRVTRSEALLRFVRWGLSFDIAPMQAQLSALMITMPDLPPAQRAQGYVARGLALLALGAPDAGIAHLDSAALLAPDLALQSAQWRALAGVLGVPGVSDADARASGERLRTLAADPRAGVRAHWTLGVVAALAGDGARARRHAAAVAPTVPALALLIDALVTGATDPRAALRRTASLRGPVEEQNRLGDPFARAVLHLQRAQWLERAGDRGAAERERRWHEASDFEGWLDGEMQAAEVDWVVGSYVRVAEGARRVERGDATACADLQRVLDLWTGAEPEVRARASAGVTAALELCR